MTPVAKTSTEKTAKQGVVCGARYPDMPNWVCNRAIGHAGEHSACIDSIEWEDDDG